MPKFDRRAFLTGTAAFSTFIVLDRSRSQALIGPFKLDPLPYAANALEPHIDAKTMEIHPGRHHQGYVNNLNIIAKDYPQIAQKPIEEVLAKLGELPETIRTAVRNNLGGHANHTMFWQIMGKDGGQPDGDLKAAIDRDLGGLERFQNDFNAAGLRVFGSGWVFVTVASDGKLAITTKSNQDTPLMDGGRVLIGNDVWEHAYYLLYQNRRADYLKAWWNVVNWKKVGERYAAANAGKLARRVALVIGNSAYQHVARLDNPGRDARGVSAAFRRVGFTDVVEMYDLSLKELVVALRSFEERATGAEWAVVYYSGHGISVDRINYLVPVDARLERAGDTEDEALSLERVLARVAGARKLQLVILDACRNNPFAIRMLARGQVTRSIGRGLVPIELQAGVYVAYAARDGQLALDGPAGAHSPYASAFIKHLEEPGLEIGKFFRKVRDTVLAETRGAQQPFEYGSLPGEDFYFRAAAR